MATHEDRWPAGTPCWVELAATDLARSQAFYRAVLGWEFEDAGEAYGHYNNALLGGRRVAGLSVAPVELDWPTVWTTYFATDDIDATATAAASMGAKPFIEDMAAVMDIGDFGRAGMWIDTAGAAFAAWEAREHTGHVAHNEHGAVGWVDLVTPDVVASQRFYGSIFGLTYDAVEVGDTAYAMFTAAGGDMPVGGMGEQEPDDSLPPRWCVTFEVDDVDAARRRVLDAGGEAPDAPLTFEYGRIVTVKGPDGEEFSLMTSTSPPEVGSSDFA